MAEQAASSAWPIVVCDSFGVGEAPDAAAYGDAGSNTLGPRRRGRRRARRALAGAPRARAASPRSTGLALRAEARDRARAACTERSAGKDTTTGHWEMAGVVLERPFPTYPDGFPPEVIQPFEAAIGREVLGNVAPPGTEIIAELGRGAHSHRPADRVHERRFGVPDRRARRRGAAGAALRVVPDAARGILDGTAPRRSGDRPAVRRRSRGRSSARPTGATSPWRRPRRRCWTSLSGAGIPVYGVGKIGDIFDGHGVTEFRYSRSNDDGVDIALEYLARPGSVAGVRANLVDFDSKYGHRNDPVGYAAALEAFDRRVPELLGDSASSRRGRSVARSGVLFVTGDHGCDPTDVSTDHTREYVPVAGGGDGCRCSGRARDAIDLRRPGRHRGGPVRSGMVEPTAGRARRSRAGSRRGRRERPRRAQTEPTGAAGDG